MTKKQWSIPNVRVGTVKKSIAAIASLWLFRNAAHRFAGRAPGGLTHPSQHGSFRDVVAEHFQLAMNARRTPSLVFAYHAKDKLAQFLAHTSSAHSAATPREPCPVQCEACASPK